MPGRIGFFHFVDGWHTPLKALTDALSASNKKDLDQSLMVLPEALNTGKH